MIKSWSSFFSHSGKVYFLQPKQLFFSIIASAKMHHFCNELHQNSILIPPFFIDTPRISDLYPTIYLLYDFVKRNRLVFFQLIL